MQYQRVILRLLAQHPALERPPPEEPPADMTVADYTMDGSDGTPAARWHQHIRAPDRPVHPIGDALQKYKEDIDGKVGLVIGTEKPWVEAHLLNAGAEHVVTLEYGRIRSEHPRLTPVLPEEIVALYLEKGGVQVDFVMSYSSLEHSGMGRYGDALNPFGDFEAMAQAWCLLKPGGLAMVGVPTADGLHQRVGKVFWNAHRVYSAVRASHLGANFDFVEHLLGETDIAQSSEFFVFRKPADPENKLFVE